MFGIFRRQKPPFSLYHLALSDFKWCEIATSSALLVYKLSKLDPNDQVENCYHNLEKENTLPETNMAPENRQSQKEINLPTIHFQVLC